MSITAWWLLPAAMAGVVVGGFLAFLFSCGKRGDDGIKELVRQDAPRKMLWMYRK